MTTPSSWAGWISLSRDGRRLAFVDRNERTTLERAPFDASRGVLAAPPLPVPLGTIELYDRFELSADGSSVLFGNSGLPQFLFLARADGSDVRQLSDGPHRDRQAAFSPDGQWIAFQTTRWPSQFGLVRPDGSGMRGVVSDRTDGWFPVWAPDGKRLVVSSQDGAYFLDPWAKDPAHATTMLPAPPDGTSFVPRCWSTDGRAIVGTLRDRVGAPNTATVYSLADSSYRNVPRVLDDIACLADGRRIVGSTSRTIELVDLASGAARTISAPAPGREILSVVLSRDEKWIAWIEAADESDVWLAELGP